MPLPVPKYPLVILTPNLFPPTPSSLPHLIKTCNRYLKSSETYSVTYSPLLCPAGKGYLFSLKPYYWEVSPGQWEQRDGVRNPYCDLPKGQKQLENMAMAVYTLALGTLYVETDTIRSRCSERMEELLEVFFVDKDTRMRPEVAYAQCHPGRTPLAGDQAFVIACRYLLLITQILPLIHLTPELDVELRKWFEAQVEWMATSEQGAKARGYGNNITVWYHALVASHLSYLNPTQSLTESTQTFHTLIRLHPTPTSFFARELSRTRPRHYTLFTLEPLFLLASHTYPKARSLRSPYATNITVGDGNSTVEGSAGRVVVQEEGAEKIDRPPRDIMEYMESLLDFAGRVEGSEIEVHIEGQGRYEAKMQWFNGMMKRWEDGGGQGNDWNLDGKEWEGGWNSFSRLEWELI